jgi:hypothetical protein
MLLAMEQDRWFVMMAVGLGSVTVIMVAAMMLWH